MPKAQGLGQSIGQSIRQMPIIADPGSVFRRGEGGILPERGSRSQRDTVLALLSSGLQSAGQTGSPLLAALAPVVSGAVGTRTEGLFNDAQAGRDQAAIDRLLGAMGGGYSAPGAAPMAGGAGSDVLSGSGGADYFGAIRQAESGGNDAARNPASSATGRYQFIQSTWDGLRQQYPELGLTPDGRTDPAQQERAIRQFTADNAQALSSAGIAPTPGNLYAAHFLGAGDARRVLSAAPGQAISAIVSPGVIQANPFLQGMSVADFQRWSDSKGTGGPITGGAGNGMVRGDGGADMLGGGPGMNRALLELMVDPNISPELRSLAGSLAGQTPNRPAPIDPIQVERDRIGLEMDRARLADMLAPEPPADAMSPDMIRQINVAIESITTAIRSLELQGLTREEAQAQVRGDPLYARQWELVQAGQATAPGAAPASPASPAPRTSPPPPPPGTVPF